MVYSKFIFNSTMLFYKLCIRTMFPILEQKFHGINDPKNIKERYKKEDNKALVSSKNRMGPAMQDSGKMVI